MLIGGIAVGAYIGDPVAWWSRVEGLRGLAWYALDQLVVESPKYTARLVIRQVTNQYFSVMGISAIAGSTCEGVGTRPGSAVISRAVASSGFDRLVRFGVDRITVAGNTFDVIGVADDVREWATDVWICAPYPEPVLSGGEARELGWVGLVKAGVSPDTLADQLTAVLNETNSKLGPITGRLYGDVVTVQVIR